MSKKLAIVRHGKSTWEFPGISDADRPLKEVGINNTRIICQELKKKKIKPDLIITSHAIRALHTALITARELSYPIPEIKLEPELYNDSEEEVLEIIKSLENNVQSVFIFGHNPTFTILSNYFLKQKIENLPTSGIAYFEFDCNNWNEISQNNKISELCLFPKMLDAD